MSNQQYEHKVYGSAQFFVEGGMYSIEQLEEMIAAMKNAKSEMAKASANMMHEVGHV